MSHQIRQDERCSGGELGTDWATLQSAADPGRARYIRDASAPSDLSEIRQDDRGGPLEITLRASNASRPRVLERVTARSRADLGRPVPLAEVGLYATRSAVEAPTVRRYCHADLSVLVRNYEWGARRAVTE